MAPPGWPETPLEPVPAIRLPPKHPMGPIGYNSLGYVRRLHQVWGVWPWEVVPSPSSYPKQWSQPILGKLRTLAIYTTLGHGRLLLARHLGPDNRLSNSGITAAIDEAHRDPSTPRNLFESCRKEPATKAPVRVNTEAPVRMNLRSRKRARSQTGASAAESQAEQGQTRLKPASAADDQQQSERDSKPKPDDSDLAIDPGLLDIDFDHFLNPDDSQPVRQDTSGSRLRPLYPTGGLDLIASRSSPGRLKSTTTT
ncbi:hypothetical protein GGR56DRAFT_660614, partial [Xylariaceae sp. FL0804]